MVAVDGLLAGAGFTEVFASMRRSGIPPARRLSDVTRVFRAGGLTKDAIYLRGLAELLTYLKSGGELEPLFTGKLAVSSVEQLPHRGGARADPDASPPPRWADAPGPASRIAAARTGLTSST